MDTIPTSVTAERKPRDNGLAAAIDRLGATANRIADERNRLRCQRWELRGMLKDVLEYLDDHVDVVDGDYGQPAPNKAMRLVQEIEETLKRTEG
jgi:hypothetical protein